MMLSARLPRACPGPAGVRPDAGAGGGTRAGDGTGGQPARGAAPPAAALTSLSPTLVGAGPGARFGRARGRGRGSPPAPRPQISGGGRRARRGGRRLPPVLPRAAGPGRRPHGGERRPRRDGKGGRPLHRPPRDRKSTRLNSSHVKISYAVFCL